MVNPQVENGFIPIATGAGDNDVLSALARARLSGVEYQIVLWVMRQTWGYGKKEDWVSLTQFEKVTGASRSYVCRAIDRLVTRGVLVTRKSPGKTFYGFNKRFDEWVVTSTSPVTPTSPEVVTPASRASDAEDNRVVTPASHTKETPTKDISTKENTATQYGRADINDLIETMKRELGLPVLDGSRERNRWAAKNLIDKITSVTGDHGRAMDNIHAAIACAARSEFWSRRVTSVRRLADNFVAILKDSQAPPKGRVLSADV